MSVLSRRIAKLEAQHRPGTVLAVLIRPGERVTREEATERATAAWGRPAETFALDILIDLRGRAVE